MDGDPIKELNMSEEERQAFRTHLAMKELLGFMIHYEEKSNNAISEEKIITSFQYLNLDTTQLIRELLDLTFITCIEGRDGDGRECATTLLGRDWYHHEEGSQKEKNVQFFFADGSR